MGLILALAMIWQRSFEVSIQLNDQASSHISPTLVISDIVLYKSNPPVRAGAAPPVYITNCQDNGFSSLCNIA